MSNFLTVRDLLDDEAHEAREEEELEEEDEDDFDEFIHDGEDIGEGTSPAPSSPPTVSQDPAAEASGLEEAASRIRARYLHDDPGLWAVPVKAGQEVRVLEIILDRFADLYVVPSVTVRPSIPGYVLVESNSIGEVYRCLAGISSVLKPVKPRLIPVPNRTEYLLPVPSRPEICDGQWVRCKYGLYAEDVGLVRETRAGNAQVVVALLPRICVPVLPGVSTRAKGRPDPRLWGYTELLSVFGESKVKLGHPTQGEEHASYKFAHDTFECGLILKVFSSKHLELATALPHLLCPFSKHPGIFHDPAFTCALTQVTRVTYQREDRVEVTSGEYRGVVGAITIALGGRASIAAMLPGEHSERLIEVDVDIVQPRFRPGNHVESRLSDSTGIVAGCDYDAAQVTYLERGTQAEFTTSCFAIRFAPPAPQVALPPKVAVGDRVVLFGREARLRDGPTKLEGVVEEVKGDRVRFTDERTKILVTASMGELRQLKRPVPHEKPDPKHLTVGHEVAITKGNYKGYCGIVKTVSDDGPIIELEAKSTQHASSRQLVKWDHISTA
ncbi:hypothetical protein BC834DRAFT_973637 [Gloeopeniophorella convolvens]|nr:hypothetical protein BC834DRAFT_973637 [Gloeopeniophorella convolvens]